MRYSIDPAERRYVKRCEFLSFARNLNNKYGQKRNKIKRQVDERNKGIAFKNCAPFTTCKSDINNIEIDFCQDIDIIMPMYNLIEYIDNYAKTSGSLWQYYRDEPSHNLADSQ